MGHGDRVYTPIGIISFTLTWGVLGPLALSVTKVQHVKERFSVVGRSRTQKGVLFLTWAQKGHYLASTGSATVTPTAVPELVEGHTALRLAVPEPPPRSLSLSKGIPRPA